jgi:hypothetical protein
MLSDISVNYLLPLKYRLDAERRSCVLPLGGTYWSDEIPNFRHLLEVPEDDRNLIYRLFSTRFKIWNGDDLSADDQQFWDTAQSQVSGYPLFRRLQLSPEDRLAQDQMGQDALASLEALFAGSRKITITTNKYGFQSFSATCDLTKDNVPPGDPGCW